MGVCVGGGGVSVSVGVIPICLFGVPIKPFNLNEHISTSDVYPVVLYIIIIML